MPINGLPAEEDSTTLHAEVAEKEVGSSSEKDFVGVDVSDEKPGSFGLTENVTEKEKLPLAMETKIREAQIWARIRPSLCAIEDMMSYRVKKKINLAKNEQDTGTIKPAPPIEEARPAKAGSEEDSEEEFYDVERSDPVQDVPSSDSVSAPKTVATGEVVPPESSFPGKEELECLVQGGVPMALRGEVICTLFPFLILIEFMLNVLHICLNFQLQLWQAFVGVRARRVENYYKDLLATDTNSGDSTKHQSSELDEDSKGSMTESVCIPEKWKAQIEKVITYARFLFSFLLLLYIYTSNTLNC